MALGGVGLMGTLAVSGDGRLPEGLAAPELVAQPAGCDADAASGFISSAALVPGARYLSASASVMVGQTGFFGPTPKLLMRSAFQRGLVFLTELILGFRFLKPR